MNRINEIWANFTQHVIGIFEGGWRWGIKKNIKENIAEIFQILWKLWPTDPKCSTKPKHKKHEENYTKTYDHYIA